MSRSARLRSATRRILGAVTDELRPGGAGESITLGYPASSDPRPRWGHGRPPHRTVEAILREHDDSARAALETIAGYVDDLASIPRTGEQSGPGESHWRSAHLPAVDLASLYAFVRERKPRRYIEVGSGHSTKAVRRAIRDGGLDTTIVSIDPSPRAEIDALCDVVHRTPLELLSIDELDISADDLVFFDGSHRVFTSSDVTVFYLDVLPSLPVGTFVGIHDIHWPDDYLPEWREFWFSEQYLLGAYLLGRAPWLRTVLATYHATTDPELAKILDPLWERIGWDQLDRRGFGFWLEIAPGA